MSRFGTTKYYAVRKGWKTGIFRNRNEFQQAVKGFPGAEWKIVSRPGAAQMFLKMGSTPTNLQIPRQKPTPSALFRPKQTNMRKNPRSGGLPPRTYNQSFKRKPQSKFRGSSSFPRNQTKRYPNPHKASYNRRVVNSAPKKKSFGLAKKVRKISGKRSRLESKTVTRRRVFADLSRVKWNKEQQEVLTLVKSGRNVFFTGGAGTGKSLVTQKIFEVLCRKYGAKNVAITATTGISAVNVNGITIHRFSGVGAKKNYKDMLKKAQWRKREWKSCRALIIDEISMLDAELFDNLERLARDIRTSTLPFGGIQLILTGDFFQLPPVINKFCFESESWDRCVRKYVNLKTVYRQKNVRFVKMLNSIRYGICTPEIENALRARVRACPENSKIPPTKMFSKNNRVNELNQKKLNELKGGSEYKYEPFDYCREGGVEGTRLKSVLSNTQAMENLNLKINAQVILTKNLSDRLVNGSRGKIVGFKRSDKRLDKFESKILNLSGIPNKKAGWVAEYEEYIDEFFQISKMNTWVPIVEFRDGKKIEIGPEVFVVENQDFSCIRVQIPLKLAWALTIHKCQGLSIDQVEISMKNMFCCGHFYVALSRVRTLSGLYLRNFDRSQIRADPRVLRFMKRYFKNYEEEMKKEVFGSNEEMGNRVGIEWSRKEIKKDLKTMKPKKKRIKRI